MSDNIIYVWINCALGANLLMIKISASSPYTFTLMASDGTIITNPSVVCASNLIQNVNILSLSFNIDGLLYGFDLNSAYQFGNNTFSSLSSSTIIGNSNPGGGGGGGITINPIPFTPTNYAIWINEHW